MSRRKTSAEAVEEFRQAWREFIFVFAASLGLIRLAYWLNDKLTKEERK